MMIQRLLLFLLVISASKSFGQMIIIDDNVVLKPGIYKDFEEFKFNNPSILLIYKIDSNEYKSIDQFNPENSHFSYRLIIDKQKAKQIGSVFGFCDGHRIFINETNPIISEKVDFELLQFVGLYSYFEQFVYLPGEMGAPNSSIIIDKMININNGDVTIITDQEIGHILSNDNQLLKQFTALIDKKTNVKDYLALYSLKHKQDGVLCRDKKMTKAEADSFITRQKTDTTDMLYYHRLASKLKTNPAFSDAKFEEEYYENGTRKSIGFNTRCNFDPNDQFLYCVGLWKSFYENGLIKEEIFYSITSKIISRIRYDENGKIVK